MSIGNLHKKIIKFSPEKGLTKYSRYAIIKIQKKERQTPWERNLIDRMIRIYGFEHPIVIQFAELCERMADTEYNNKALMTLVEVHEKNPAF